MIVTAWAVVISLLILGLMAMHFARECRKTSNRQAKDIITQMETIECRFKS